MLEPTETVQVFFTCSSYSEAAHRLCSPSSLTLLLQILHQDMGLRNEGDWVSNYALPPGYALFNGESDQFSGRVMMQPMFTYEQRLEGSMSGVELMPDDPREGATAL